MTDIIILLNGNFIPLRVQDRDVVKSLKFVDDAITASHDEPGHFIRLSETSCVISKNIIGYYTKPVVETAQEKVVKILEQSVKKESDGDSWKDDR